MPVVIGLASSHAPSMFTPPELWPQVHTGLTRGLPQPPKFAEETPEIVAQQAARVKAGFATFIAELKEASVDLVVIVGDDQTEVFNNACTPSIGIYTGEGVSGTTSISWIGQKPEDNHIFLKGCPGVAKGLLTFLMKAEFDLVFSDKLHPLGKPTAGIGHAFSRIARAMQIGDTDMPIIPIFLNGYHAPMPSGARCYSLGRAIERFFAKRTERVAIYASGGLSHCPVGPRAGWVDEPLDRWVLDRIETGNGEELSNLFLFDSDTLRSGTGEIRSWITVAGAFHGVPGKVVDYIPSIHSVTGLGFAMWKAQ